MTLGESIKKRRKELKLTQKELAKKIGCAEITLRQYENDKRKPDFKTLSIIAIMLEVTLRELIPLELQQSTTSSNITELFSGFSSEEFKNFETFEDYLNYKAEKFSKVKHYGKIKYSDHPGTTISSHTTIDELYIYHQKLNSLGRKKLIEHAEMLTKIPEYRKDNE